MTIGAFSDSVVARLENDVKNNRHRFYLVAVIATTLLSGTCLVLSSGIGSPLHSFGILLAMLGLALYGTLALYEWHSEEVRHRAYREILLDVLASKLMLAQTFSHNTLGERHAAVAHIERRNTVWEVIRAAAEIRATPDEMRRIIDAIDPIVMRDAVDRYGAPGRSWPEGSECFEGMLAEHAQRRGNWSAHEIELFEASAPPF